MCAPGSCTQIKSGTGMKLWHTQKKTSWINRGWSADKLGCPTPTRLTTQSQNTRELPNIHVHKAALPGRKYSWTNGNPGTTHTALTPAGLQIPPSIESTQRPLLQNTLKIGRELFYLTYRNKHKNKMSRQKNRYQMEKQNKKENTHTSNLLKNSNWRS